MTKKCYIAGPISGYNIDERLAAFQKIEEFLKSIGYEPINPMRVHPPDPNGITNGISNESKDKSEIWKRYMKWDIKLVLECDKIFMMRGWKESKGASLEHYVAQELGLNILYERSSEGNNVEEMKVGAEADSLVYGDREDTYDHPAINAERILRRWNAELFEKLKPGEKLDWRNYWHMMVDLKLARDVKTVKRDTYVDTAGYAIVGYRIAKYKEKKLS